MGHFSFIANYNIILFLDPVALKVNLSSVDQQMIEPINIDETWIFKEKSPF